MPCDIIAITSLIILCFLLFLWRWTDILICFNASPFLFVSDLALHLSTPSKSLPSDKKKMFHIYFIKKYRKSNEKKTFFFAIASTKSHQIKVRPNHEIKNASRGICADDGTQFPDGKLPNLKYRLILSWAVGLLSIDLKCFEEWPNFAPSPPPASKMQKFLHRFSCCFLLSRH